MKRKRSTDIRRKFERRDRVARRIIALGGYGVIISIAAILFFLFYQSLPLSFGAKIKEWFSWTPGDRSDQILLVGVDQYQEVVYFLDQHGEVEFLRMKDRHILLRDSLPLEPGEKIFSADRGSLLRDVFAAGTDKGRILIGEIHLQPRFEGSVRRIVPSLSVEQTFQAETPGDSLPAHIEKVSFRRTEDGLELLAWVNHAGHLFLRIYDPEEETTYRYDLSEQLGNLPITTLTMNYSGETLIVASEQGDLFWFDLLDPEEVVLVDHWRASGVAITAVSYLLGNNAIVVGDAQGEVSEWFPTKNPLQKTKFTLIRRFKPHRNPVTLIAASPRNRNFLTVDSKGEAHLNYATTDATQLEFLPSDYPLQAVAFAPKSNGIVAADSRHRLGVFRLDNPHPETTLHTLFGKVWYEGYQKPAFVWQSTGGSDEFEPKLSLVPLIFGTFKGTLYAMFFSVPLAILAAIYVSQFAPQWMSRIVKPIVEILAAFPSVVIGFLAGLYFAPLFEKHLVQFLIFSVALPVVFLVGVVIWKQIPEETRTRFPRGVELGFVLLVVLAAFSVADLLAFPVRETFFAGDLKQWLYTHWGVVYDQRNSLVVGFALGFAVIPIIFTIAEDALSNVPKSLSSAALALGASRWQTVRRVVLPAAAGGIFAGVMLGFGRAIGETMIVLMATGNTPILDLSPFNGFRAMSACIAVEIPEAPVGGTLYRVLFLTALLLFLFTFIVNTLASLVGDKLRKKYARF